jgi:hypothetical protein
MEELKCLSGLQAVNGAAGAEGLAQLFQAELHARLDRAKR